MGAPGLADELNEGGSLHQWASAMRDYVTANDEQRYDGLKRLGDNEVRLNVTHSNLQQRWHDILVAREMTVMQVKEKLYRHGGSLIDMVDLYLRRENGSGNTIFLADDTKTLQYYGVDNGMELHIVDNDPHSKSLGGWLEDTSLVEKYMMSEEDYDKREKTVRNYKREKAKEEGLKFANAPEKEVDMEAYVVGARCEVNPGGRRGTIRYVGPVGESADTFVGVRFDEPVGLNDGTKDGKVYFDDCPPKYGAFARPQNVTVGDFPELDPFADLGSDDEI